MFVFSLRGVENISCDAYLLHGKKKKKEECSKEDEGQKHR